ncbi:alpha-ketoglutarate-dependent dioxygenase alkB homolog 6 isoform X2 [Herrania umbratica]|uniref:Alpha-ketoglutarate-dependent dioxygenase alkB homolog 6 isoform X2 n=1 Tax=Herrania umbratica TaxID=108875 RepID=A0A6J1BDG6_9ROSI|nr:alpha-ketoglutarate-dependent dioxygenase alkB homolog 6 isoform X2 [Herrania umbratica]
MGMERKEKLNNFIVGDLPTLIYIPDFITDSEQAQLLNNIYQAPVSKWKSLKNRRLQNWGGVVHEKGLLPQDLPPWLAKITERIYEGSGLFPSAINHVLINEYLPNQGIMPHQDGPAYYPVVAILSLGSPVVMDFTPHPRLQSCKRTLKENVGDKISNRGAVAIEANDGSYNHCPFSVLLIPRSLLIFKDDAYSDYLHGIEDCEVHRCDQAVNEIEALSVSRSGQAEVMRSDNAKIVSRTVNRISLTCRLVLNVHKNLFKF